MCIFVVQHYTWSKCEQFYLLHIVYKIILLAVMSEYACETVVVLAGLLRPFICTLFHSCRLVHSCRAEANISYASSNYIRTVKHHI